MVNSPPFEGGVPVGGGGYQIDMFPFLALTPHTRSEFRACPIGRAICYKSALALTGFPLLSLTQIPLTDSGLIQHLQQLFLGPYRQFRIYPGKVSIHSPFIHIHC